MQLKVVKKENMTPNDDEKSVWCIEFEGVDAKLDYQPGDWLTLQVSNPPALVRQLLEMLALSGDETVALRRVGEVSVLEAFTDHLEITQLNPAVLNKLQRQWPEALGGQHWADRQAMSDYAQGRDILDLLSEFPVLTSQPLHFLTFLLPLSPRYYSIASSTRVHPNRARLLVRQVRYQRQGRWREGAASTAIAHSQMGQIFDGDVVNNRNFKLPEPLETPIIMLAGGVGLAPFLGFMEHRIALMAEAGKVFQNHWLFFGETHQDTTFLCHDQLETWQQEGTLKLTTAFSRDQSEKVYVQHRMLEQAEAIWQWLEEGAHLYVCGDRHRFAPAVEQALQNIIERQAGQTAKQTQLQLQTWKQSGRFQLDVF